MARNPRLTGLPDNVLAEDLDSLADHQAPVMICVSEHEQSIIRAHLASGRKLDRTVVAGPNRRLLDRLVVPAHWQSRPILVVTNPVEVICGHLRRITGCQEVYGFGMQSSAARLREVLAAGWDTHLDATELAVSGTHTFGPVPILSSLPGLAEQVASVPWPTVRDRLVHAAAGGRLPWVRDLDRLRAVLAAREPDDAYDRLAAATSALTAAEFEQDRPPSHRAAHQLGELVDAWLGDGQVPMSGPIRWSPADGTDAVIGGSLDVATGSFTVPAMDAVEATRVSEQIERLRALDGEA